MELFEKKDEGIKKNIDIGFFVVQIKTIDDKFATVNLLESVDATN